MVGSTVFHYRARTASGDSVNGTLRAWSRLECLKRLHERDLFVISMESAATLRGAFVFALAHRRSRRASCIGFLRSVSVLISAGTPLLRALEVSAELCQDRQFAETVRTLVVDINGGASLSEAMMHRPLEFSETIVAMVRAGEVGGILDEVLQRGATILEQTQALRRRVFATLTYPAFVLAAATALVAFLLAVTVPAFGGILAELHGSVPFMTRILLALSYGLRDPRFWAVSAAGATAFSLVCVAVGRDARARLWLDRRSLEVPVVGAIRREANVAAFSRTVGTLLQCGVNISEAIESSVGVLSSEAYRHAARRAKELVMSGLPLSQALRDLRLFDGLCLELTNVGEESGTLDTTLRRAADYLEENVRLSLRSLTAVVEPALILVLGGIVGGTVASVLVPLYAAVGNMH